MTRLEFDYRWKVYWIEYLFDVLVSSLYSTGLVMYFHRRDEQVCRLTLAMWQGLYHSVNMNAPLTWFISRLLISRGGEATSLREKDGNAFTAYWLLSLPLILLPPASLYHTHTRTHTLSLSQPLYCRALSALLAWNKTFVLPKLFKNFPVYSI